MKQMERMIEHHIHKDSRKRCMESVGLKVENILDNYKKGTEKDIMICNITGFYA